MSSAELAEFNKCLYAEAELPLEKAPRRGELNLTEVGYRVKRLMKQAKVQAQSQASTPRFEEPLDLAKVRSRVRRLVKQAGTKAKTPRLEE